MQKRVRLCSPFPSKESKEEGISSIKKVQEDTSNISAIKDFVPANQIFRASEVLKMSSQ